MIMATPVDIDIQRDVLDEFAWDPQIEPTEVGVQVDDGVVTLTGAIESYAMKLAAERAVQRVTSVRAVANDLTIKGIGTRNDTDIAKAAANALEANCLVPPGRIDVTVKNGKVTLTGEVNWAYQRTVATDSVRHLLGVRDVVTLVTIKQPTVSTVEVTQGIERALVRAAEVDASRIQVHVENGHVRLTGTARSWPEKQAASMAAWNAKGVTDVTNEIGVWSV